ncbi:MAG: thermonuclease family protein [Mariprofundales bacterium]
MNKILSKHISVYTVCLLLSLIFAPMAMAGTLSIVSSSRYVHVGKVIDGDTFRTDKGEKIRLLAINTPEVAHGRQAGQPLGKKASKQLRSLIEGKNVLLRFDEEKKDRYGRTLAHVYLPNDIWVNGELLRLGLAHVYTFAPNFRYVDELLKIEANAMQARRGLWQHERFAKLDANKISSQNIGQYRVIDGIVRNISRNGFGFKLANNKLKITIPRKYRQYFTNQPKLSNGLRVRVRGMIRASRDGNELYLAIHSPYDLKVLE